jgi:stress response protein YsnF
VERSPNGWTVRLPLRAEQITLEKRAVLVERVVVRTTPVEDQVRVEESIQREQLEVTTEGEVRVVQPNPIGGEASQEPVKPPTKLPAWRGIPGTAQKP